ncbi:MAG: PEGA domain-containing protein [Deltaproteobacteria bacterium]|nr:PEGA domain-containing protein [Deltaproteobacteria bacterium]
MSSAKAKSRGWTGFLDRGKRKDTDPASSSRPPLLSFDDPTFDDVPARAPAERTLLDGVPVLQREAEVVIPPDDVPAGSIAPPPPDGTPRVGLSPERTELVDAASLGLEFGESTDHRGRAIQRTYTVDGEPAESQALSRADTDRPGAPPLARDTEPPVITAPARSSVTPSKPADESDGGLKITPATRSDTEAEAATLEAPDAADNKNTGRFRGMSFRPIRERNRTLSKSREVNIPDAETQAEPAPDRKDPYGLEGPAGLKHVRVGEDEAELTMLHPAVAIGIAPAPGASPRVPGEGRLRIPEGGLEMPSPDKAPPFRLDKPNSPLSRLEPEPQKEYNPLTDNDPALEAAVWATDNLSRLKTLFRIIPISMIAGLMLAGIFATTRAAMRNKEKNEPDPNAVGTLVAPLDPPEPEPQQPERVAPPPAQRSGLAINSAPPYAMVSLNGAEIGRTPLVLRLPERDVPLKIRIAADEHKPWEAEIKLTDELGGTIEVSAQSYTGTGTSAARTNGRHQLEIRLARDAP